MNRLHIHSQTVQHGDAFILGTRAGLTALRNAIDAALAGTVAAAASYTADGEGFTAFVIEYDFTGDPPLPYGDVPGADVQKHIDAMSEVEDRAWERERASRQPAPS